MTDEMELIRQLQAGRIRAFKTFCYQYSEDMILLAYGLLEDSVQANRIVCDILQRLLSSGFKNVTLPLHGFLYGEVRKACGLPIADKQYADILEEMGILSAHQEQV